MIKVWLLCTAVFVSSNLLSQTWHDDDDEKWGFSFHEPVPDSLSMKGEIYVGAQYQGANIKGGLAGFGEYTSTEWSLRHFLR